MADVSRNSPCPCGSGKKYKMCCGAAVVAAERAAEAEKSRFWTPEGVTVEDDDTPGAFSRRPKWGLLEHVVREWPDDDLKKLFLNLSPFRRRQMANKKLSGSV
jgi:hypothetical protein